jgi:hypothetical protein
MRCFKLLGARLSSTSGGTADQGRDPEPLLGPRNAKNLTLGMSLFNGGEEAGQRPIYATEPFNGVKSANALHVTVICVKLPLLYSSEYNQLSKICSVLE